jgi:hypothetical protein
MKKLIASIIAVCILAFVLGLLVSPFLVVLIGILACLIIYVAGDNPYTQGYYRNVKYISTRSERKAAAEQDLKDHSFENAYVDGKKIAPSGFNKRQLIFYLTGFSLIIIGLVWDYFF